MAQLLLSPETGGKNMIKGLYVAASGSLAIERQMATIANNLANVDTSGFKRDFPVFQSIPPRKEETSLSDQSLPNPLTFTFAGKNVTDYSQGPLISTGNPNDVALEGPGFFTVQSGNEFRYTRHLSLVVNENGDLLTTHGEKVIGVFGGKYRPIENLGEGPLTIGPDGSISQNGGVVGQLRIVDFPKPYPLEKVGYDMFRAKGQAQPVEAKNTTVHQGMVEKPNVSAIREMTQMITALRGYEAYQKVITSLDDLTGRAVNDLGRIG